MPSHNHNLVDHFDQFHNGLWLICCQDKFDHYLKPPKKIEQIRGLNHAKDDMFLFKINKVSILQSLSLQAKYHYNNYKIATSILISFTLTKDYVKGF